MKRKSFEGNPNNRRSNIISSLKRKNLNLIKSLREYMRGANLTKEEESHLLRLEKDASRCANFSLYGTDTQKESISYFASVMCGNKCCFVCNYARQKRLRRKYFSWFKSNPVILEVAKGLSRKYVTRTKYQEQYEKKGYKIAAELGYDIMHLTLTVPHYEETGFNGDLYYFQKIADLYHDLRNETKNWNKLVFGGEYGIETTKSKNGLHIHIHSLLFVRQMKQNRNKLHWLILREWNKRTINRASPRETLTDEVLALILKGNSLLTKKKAATLHPGGTTLINLETIYSLQEGEKVRTRDFNSLDMLYSIMEAIKYHFEPLAFDKADKSFDFDLMVEIMPKIYHRQLYRKFGCLHGEKALNIKNEDTTLEDFHDAILVNPDTGEIQPEHEFFLSNPSHVFHDSASDNSIYLSREGKRKAIKLPATTVSGAVNMLSEIVQRQYKRKAA